MRANTRKRPIYPTIALAALLMASAPVVAEPLPDPPPGFHGMLVLGTRDNVYLVHLAMRSASQHMFQLILRVDFTRGTDTEVGDRSFLEQGATLETVSPNQLYFFDRNHPDNDVAVYTFQPGESFVLTKIPEGERLTFRGDVVRGHFERDRDAPVFLRDVVVSVRDVVFFQDLRALDTSEPHPLAAGRREFLLFGSGEEYFLTHRITLHGGRGRPDNNGFHQVLPLRADTSEELTLDLSSRAVAVEVELGATDTELYPVNGAVLQATLAEPSENGPLQIALGVAPEHYFEDLM